MITRWGAWLEAAVNYSKNFDLIKEVVNELDENEAASIGIAKKLLK